MSGLTLIDAMADPQLFAPWFAGPSWDAWRAVTKGAFALPMSDEDRATFRGLAERAPPARPVREAWIIAGRRAGKDSIASVIAAHSAALFSGQRFLRPGERALVMCLACDRDQARIVKAYIRAFFDIPMLGAMVTRETANGFELDNGVDIAVATNSFRSVRGRPILCAILDEIAFWRDENSATPDEETFKAIQPALATLPGSMIIGISSPYRRTGLLYRKYRENFGRDGDVLVIKAPTLALNPTIDPAIIERALVEDPAAARSEWLAEWRDDIAAFLSRELIEAAVDSNVATRPPLKGRRYFAFADPSGGAGDSFTLAIAHRDDEKVVVDSLLERRSPFNPHEVAGEFCQAMKEYGLRTCTGDRYAAQWVVQSFAGHGVEYRHSKRDRSELYADALPLFTSGRARLIDNPKLVKQLAALERKTTATRDKIDHPARGNDDLSNAACGALVLAAEKSDAVLSGAIICYPNRGTAPNGAPGPWERLMEEEAAIARRTGERRSLWP